MAVPTYQPTATLAPVVLEANSEYGPCISFPPASSRRALFEEDDDDDDEESNSDRDSVDQELLDLATPTCEDEVRSDAGSVVSFGGNEPLDSRSSSLFNLAGPSDGQEFSLPSLLPASEMRAFSDLTAHDHDEILEDDEHFAKWFDSLPEEDDVDPAATAQPVQVFSEQNLTGGQSLPVDGSQLQARTHVDSATEPVQGEESDDDKDLEFEDVPGCKSEPKLRLEGSEDETGFKRKRDGNDNGEEDGSKRHSPKVCTVLSY
ncbi:hypothetical protein LTS18_014607 [Coniosporium uncinatum]|uniref:Uncharacterized protein n=1 Tax=Coniosporium uncinatum TaxID=93489 RepID=A0ACC3DGQ1_9PEZI|nr:hypothetical protein LTS18_014607 [Coniosporium uncinatum]